MLHKVKPKVVLPDLLYQEFMHYVNKSNFEVSCLGWCSLNEGVFMVEEMKLIEQENTSAETDIDGASVAQYFFDIMNVKPAAWFHIHSHVNMTVGSSGTDDNTWRSLADEMPCVAVIVNKQRDYSCQYVEKLTVCGQADYIRLDDLMLDIPRFLEPDIIKAWDDNYKANVKEKSYNYIKPISSSFPRYSGYMGDEWDPTWYRRRKLKAYLKDMIDQGWYKQEYGLTPDEFRETYNLSKGEPVKMHDNADGFWYRAYYFPYDDIQSMMPTESAI
jgi:hypothetical protein